MSRSLACCIALLALTVPVPAQTAAPDANTPTSTLRITSRAVLVDVIVTNSSGSPITGLPKDAFTITEQGKSQTISFFEENGAARAVQQVVEVPKLPPDVFSNFSPFAQPPAVNVLLIDSLNTLMEDQSVVHSRAMKFLQSAKPGTRTAIFTMGLALHFIQGFNDDPAVLAAALSNKKNIEVEPPVMLTSQAVPSMASFLAENDTSRSIDREFRTLANLQRLAAFLQGFPGRKNIIWFTEKAPGVFLKGGVTGNPALDDELKKTIAMLGSVRAALYPVDARGTSNYALYTAENNQADVSPDRKAIRDEDMKAVHGSWFILGMSCQRPEPEAFFSATKKVIPVMGQIDIEGLSFICVARSVCSFRRISHSVCRKFSGV